MKTRQAYRLIADILALGSSPGGKTAHQQHASDSPGKNKPEEKDEGSTAAKDILHKRDDIIRIIQSGEVDWNRVVYAGSNNYVLPAMYLKLEESKLLENLPPELATHLKELYELNLERNSIILDNTSQINELLKSHNITPVFMKGLGNILDGIYSSPGERMMLDIDLLVHPDNMEEAAELLIDDGFTCTQPYDPGRKNAMKHYPPLVRENLPAFVDIHRMPLNIQYNDYFNFETALSDTRPALGNAGYMVMSDAHKIRLNFIHSQLVHWGHQNARPSLRDLYDLYLLSLREDAAEILSGFTPSPAKAAGYLRVLYRTFGIRKPLPKKIKGKGKIFLRRHELTMNHPRIGKLIFGVLKFFRLYLYIPLRSIFDKNYRLYVKVRLKDPEWYKRNLGVRKFVKKKH